MNRRDSPNTEAKVAVKSAECFFSYRWISRPHRAQNRLFFYWKHAMSIGVGPSAVSQSCNLPQPQQRRVPSNQSQV